jgi:hypothetical protein
MRRKRAFKVGRVVSILLAAGAGYLVGSWNATAIHRTDPSAAQTVALRFPQDWKNASGPSGADDPAAANDRMTTATAMVMGEPQLALFDPAPIVAKPVVPQAAVQLAAADPAAPSPAPVAAPAPWPNPAMPAVTPRQPMAAARPQAAAVPRAANRPGFMLDNAQIASIRERLHLTPDQQRMWPAVEIALRNIAFAKAHDAHRPGAPADKARGGGVDPNSAEVQDLKSAAIPLLMSFNDEQKDEVRSLAHVMGLDQLASQF